MKNFYYILALINGIVLLISEIFNLKLDTTSTVLFILILLAFGDIEHLKNKIK